MISYGHNKLAVIVKYHAEGQAIRLEDFQVASVPVKHLDALNVTNIYAALSINGDGERRVKLSVLIAAVSETRHEFPVRTKLEDRIVESAKRINISQTVDSHAS